MSKQDDLLIQRCLDGDTTAFGELVGLYQDRVFNSVCRLLGNAEDAQDVVQEAFILAYQSLNRFKGESQFSTWLYRIAYNAAISYKRKQRVVLSIDGAKNGENRSDPVDPSEEIRPEHAMEQQEQESRIQQALSQLSPDHRVVLIMKDMEGQKYETMAEILEVPVGTIRSRLHRARLELREILEQEEA